MKKLVFALTVIVTTLAFYACSVEEVGPNLLDSTQSMGFEGPGNGFLGDDEGADPIDGTDPIEPEDPIGGGPGEGPGENPVQSCVDYQETSIYWNGDEHISGVESGHDVVFLQVTGGWPSGTTYAWLLTYEDGTTNYYTHSTQVPRMVDASFDNKITQVTITARYGGCVGTGTIVANPPFPFEGGYAKVGGNFLDKIKIKGY